MLRHQHPQTSEAVRSTARGRTAGPPGWLAAAACAALVLGAPLAAPARECNVAPFGFSMPAQTEESNRPTGVVDTQWWAMGSSELDCPTVLLGIDVWEHAYFSYKCGTDGKVKRLQGRARLGFMMADGEVINWGGQVRGSGTCDEDGSVTIQMRIDAVSLGGAAMELRQSVVIDAGGGLDSIEVTAATLDWVAGPVH